MKLNSLAAVLVAVLIVVSRLPVAEAAALPAGQQKILDEALGLFARGSYQASIQAAERMQGSAPTQAAKAFLLASAYAKQQAFDKSLPHYKNAVVLKSPAESLHFDYGQALFATRNLTEAEAQFKQSIVKKFKMAASAYYIAYIRQLLEDKVAARDYYLRIQNLNSDPDKVKQPALFQLAELANEDANDEKNQARQVALLRERVVPLYERARDYEGSTPSYDQALAKLSQLDQKLAAHVETMRNGTPLPSRPYVLRLSQDIGWDSNVTTDADNVLLAVSDKDSFYSRSGVFAKYQWNFRRTFSVLPELYSSLQYHGRRSTPRVYQNDNFTFAPALRTRFEHTLRGKPAQGIFDVEFNLMLRDYTQAHKLPFFSRYWNVWLGERARIFSTGLTTVRVGFKFYEQYTPERNSLSPQLQLEQAVRIGDLDLLNSFTADYLRARNDFNDEKNYKLRHSITVAKFFEKVAFTPTLTLNLKDTMKQKGTRGNELLVNPSLVFSRGFGKRFDGTFEYAYSKNYSKSKDVYQYTKHELKLGAGYSF